MKKFFLIIMIAAFSISPIMAQEAEDSHTLAIKKMLELSNAENNYRQSLEIISQTISQQSPAMSQFAEKIMSFVKKYYKWEDLEIFMIDLYKTEFTEAEINELIDFYNTEVGKKMIVKLPVIMQKTMAYSQQVMMSHQAELIQEVQKMMQEETQKAMDGASSEGE